MLTAIITIMVIYYCATAPIKLFLERRRQHSRSDTLAQCTEFIRKHRFCKDPDFWGSYIHGVAAEHKREKITAYDVASCAYRLSSAYTPEGRDFLDIWCMMVGRE